MTEYSDSMRTEFIAKKAVDLREINKIDPVYVQKPYVKRGLRNADGTGIVAGVSNICDVRGYYMQEGEKIPMEGQLTYRGIPMTQMAENFLSENRFGYEETAYLILFGKLPTVRELEEFDTILSKYRVLPNRFIEDVVLTNPSPDIMNKLSRAILTLYSYDPSPEPIAGDLGHELEQALKLIARCPVIVANAYAAKRHYFDNESLYLHRPQDELSLAENFLYSIRHDTKFTPEEARLLDLCLVVHAEHGGGNNSAFSCRVLSSSGTDIYSSIAAAVGSLKGPRHGGANMKVMEMFNYLREDVRDWEDDEEVKDYLRRQLRKEVGDHSGLIYGMGHAIYTLSDPRALLLKEQARILAEKKGMLKELELLERVERLTPELFEETTGKHKVMCANVDMFSGFIYKMLGIPQELYTPLFAMARIVGWCAHRIEEVYNPNKIVRPAYKVVSPKADFVPLQDR